MEKLAYYVYYENFNKRKIDRYNVLSDYIIDEIKDRTANIQDKQAFADEVNSVLRYHFWAKSEYEIVLTDWPPHIDLDELDRLQKELLRYETDYGHKPRVLSINPIVAEKVDIYNQVKLNWEIFIDYLWDNLQEN